MAFGYWECVVDKMVRERETERAKVSRDSNANEESCLGVGKADGGEPRKQQFLL